MKEYLHKIKHNQFFRNVVTLASGTAGAQLIAVVFLPLITRLYGPEAYGVQGAFISISTILITISAFAYPVAIVLPKLDRDAMYLVVISSVLAVFISLLIFLLICLYGDVFVSLFNIKEIGDYIYLLPLFMLFSGWQQVVQQWLIRKKKFKTTAKITLTQALMVSGTKAGLGFYVPYASTLVVITIFGSLLYVVQALLRVTNIKNINEFVRNNIANTDYKKYIAIAYKYRDFPYYRAPQIFINTISQSLPVLMLTSLYGPATAGFYSLSRVVLSMPIYLIGKSVADVIYPRIAEAANKGEDVKRIIVDSSMNMAMISVVPFSLIFYFGPTIFKIIFGDEWEMAGEYASWLSIWSFFAFLNRPSVSAIPVLGLQRIFLLYEVISILLRISALVFGYLYYSTDIAAVIAFSVSSAALNGGLVIFTISVSGNCRKLKRV